MRYVRGMKTTTPKPPPAPWFRAIALVSTHGLRRGAEVLVRKSREKGGGFRILGCGTQLLVSEKAVNTFVVGLRDEHDKPIPAADQIGPNAELKAAFARTDAERVRAA